MFSVLRCQGFDQLTSGSFRRALSSTFLVIQNSLAVPSRKGQLRLAV